MHAERDHLVRFVFPELRERCAKRNLHLVDVDLRWGVTEEDAEKGKVLEVCLDEIERCRPFFVGILGERYGWVPPTYNVPDEPRFDWIGQTEPGHSVTALEILHGVLRNPQMAGRAHFYFRDPTFLSELPTTELADFVEESPVLEDRLNSLKAEIRGQFPVFDYTCRYDGVNERGHVLLDRLEEFGNQVLEDLWVEIVAEHPDENGDIEDEDVERKLQDAFAENRSARLVGRDGLLDELAAYATGSEKGPLIIYGEAGCGKSTVMASFVRRSAESHPETFVIPLFIGASPGSSSGHRILDRLSQTIASRLNEQLTLPTDYEESRRLFLGLLDKAAGRGPVVLVLDALDQLDDSNRSRGFDWLPSNFVPSLRVVLSCLKCDCLDSLRRRYPGLIQVPVDPLGENASRQLVDELLGQYRKKLSDSPQNDQMGLLLSKRQSQNPLFLTVACEELRVSGDFHRITERIESLPHDTEALFSQVLARIEQDHGQEFVEQALSLLACSRHGLLESEMLELLKRPDEEQLPRAMWARLFRSLRSYLRLPGEMDEGMLGFFHRQLSEAVRDRYVGSKTKKLTTHRLLAHYFRNAADPLQDSSWQGGNPRGLSEVVFHQVSARMWDAVQNTLTSVRFIETRCGLGHIYRLVEDFDATCRALPRSRPANRDLVLLATALRRESHFITRHPSLVFQSLWNLCWWRGRRRSPKFPVSADCVSTGNSNTGDQPPSRLARLMDNWLAEKNSYDPGFVWMRSLRPPWGGLETEEQTCLSADGVNCIAVSPDGKHIAMGHYTGALSVWDIGSGELVGTNSIGTTTARVILYSSDQSHIISLSAQGQAHVCDALSLEQLASLKTPVDNVVDAAIIGSGRDLCLVSKTGDVVVLRIDTGEECACYNTGDRDVIDVRTGFSVEGRYLILSSMTARRSDVWLMDLNSGCIVWNLPDDESTHQSLPRGCYAVAPGGRHIAYSSENRSGEPCLLHIWDTVANREIQTIETRQPNIATIAFSPDGKLIAAGSLDCTARVWDLVSGRDVVCLEGHYDVVNDIRFVGNGSRLLSASLRSADKTIRFWGLKAKPRRRPESKSFVSCLAFSDDGHYFATGDGKPGASVNVYLTETGAQVRCFEGHKDNINCVGFCPGRGVIASGSFDRTLRLWNIEEDRQVGSFAYNESVLGPEELCFSSDGAIMAVRCSSRCSVRSILTGEEIFRLEPGQFHPHCIALSPNGENIAVGGKGWAEVYHIGTGKRIAQSEAIGSAWLWRMAFSADGLRIACLCWADDTALVWDWKNDSIHQVAIPCSDEKALAADLPFQLVHGKLDVFTKVESTIRQIAGGEPLAHFPAQFAWVTTHPSGRLWACCIFTRLALLKLEGSAMIGTNADSRM